MGRLSDATLSGDLFSKPAPTAAPNDYPDGVPHEVCELYLQLARKVRDAGFKRYSSDAVLHRIRWHYQVERRDAEFKCNNNWTAQLSRWAMRQDASLAGFFETRERKAVEQ